MVGQVQGHRGGSWSTDASFCLPSMLIAWSRWLVPAPNVSLGPNFPALCSTCTRPVVSLGLCSLPDVGFQWLPLA